MRIALTITGVLALAMGVLWILQGMGYVHWPASSFMLDVRPWAWRGAILAAVGAALIWYARPRRL